MWEVGAEGGSVYIVTKKGLSSQTKRGHSKVVFVHGAGIWVWATGRLKEQEMASRLQAGTSAPVRCCCRL